MLMDVPLLHIHGGEVTEGAFDDAVRHSITKMANIHFPVSDEFALRIRQLGEDENSIFVIGSPGVDNIIATSKLEKGQLENSLGFNLKGSVMLVTYHPVTKTNSNENNIAPLVEAIRNNPQCSYVITYPNADGGGDIIIEQWKSISHLDNVNIVPSLGYIRYLSLMDIVDCVIGNSSSGIIEAPSFNVSTINIGSRQRGRPRASSIIDVGMSEHSISEAIKITGDPEHKRNLGNVVNPYGHGGAARKLVDHLSKLDFNSFKVKKFRDLS